MSQFPSYSLSLADGTDLLLASTDRHAADLLALFAKVTRLKSKDGSGKAVIVSSNQSDTTVDTLNEPVYRFTPLSVGKFDIRHLLELSHTIINQTKGGILVHGALAERNGKGVVLIARGGTGKTTASNRLPPPWCSLSDDLTLVVRDTHGAYWAHPWPTWSRISEEGISDSWDVQRAVRLQVIFHLTQAEIDRVKLLGIGESAILLLQSTEQAFNLVRQAFDEEHIRALRLQRFEQISILVQKVPVNELYLSLTSPFWQVLEKNLENQLERVNG